MHRLGSLLLIGAALCVTLQARASARRVALVGDDTELGRALALTLSVWDVETISTDSAPPESSQPQATLQADQLVQLLRVDGLVWISESGDASVLWIYDAHSHETTTRVLAVQRPFDSAAAAGIALSVKTALRASIEPAPAPPPRGHDLAARVAPPLPRVSISAAVAATWLAEGGATARFSLTSVVWVAAQRRLGVGLTLGGSPGVQLVSPGFRGRYRELGFGGYGHLRFVSAGAVSGSSFAGVATHLALLDGQVAGDSAPTAVKRYNVSVDAGLQLDFALVGGLFCGVSGQGSYFPAYQRYLVDGAPVFAPWQLVPSVGGHVGVSLF